MTHEAAAGAEGEALDSYVVVDREDVLDALGAFIAAYLASLPEARNLQPAQLQAALKQAFQARPAAETSAVHADRVHGVRKHTIGSRVTAGTGDGWPCLCQLHVLAICTSGHSCWSAGQKRIHFMLLWWSLLGDGAVHARHVRACMLPRALRLDCVCIRAP